VKILKLGLHALKIGEAKIHGGFLLCGLCGWGRRKGLCPLTPPEKLSFSGLFRLPPAGLRGAFCWGVVAFAPFRWSERRKGWCFMRVKALGSCVCLRRGYGVRFVGVLSLLHLSGGRKGAKGDGFMRGRWRRRLRGRRRLLLRLRGRQGQCR